MINMLIKNFYNENKIKFEQKFSFNGKDIYLLKIDYDYNMSSNWIRIKEIDEKSLFRDKITEIYKLMLINIEVKNLLCLNISKYINEYDIKNKFVSMEELNDKKYLN